MTRIVFFLLTLSYLPKVVADFGSDRVKHDRWEGLEVVYLQDERFPTYTLSIYFAEGSVGEHPRRSGETAAMFDLLTAGTRRYYQKDILENLEFFGVSYGAHVTPEYSTYNISGLVKDIVPTMKKVCHIFRDATFPAKIISKELNRSVSALKNLVSSHGALATRVFRELSMKGTPYAAHVEGTVASLGRLNTRTLKARLNHFNKSVAKKVYISGPREVSNIKGIILDECGWKGAASGKSPQQNIVKKFPRRPDIYLVTVPNANQAQVRIGRYLDGREGLSMELNALISDFMGGGLSSKLMSELRTKRGLIYSGGAMVGKQRDYGRSLVSTYTRNEKVYELIAVLKGILADISAGKTSAKKFREAQGRLIGSYPFEFEESASFLDRLLFFDHAGKSYDEFFSFRENLSKLTLSKMAEEFKSLFDWNKMTILVLGNGNLKKQMERLGTVKVIDYKTFL